MPAYRVMVRGENFLVAMAGRVQRMGFFVNRYVEAVDMEEAELLAIDLVRDDEKLRGLPKNTREDPPILYVEEMEELDSLAAINNPTPGFVFFGSDPQ